MILSHVLIQDGCYAPFPVLLSSFNKSGRRHYIQAVNTYHENPSMLYAMIKSHCFEKKMQRWAQNIMMRLYIK